jgi:insulysin
MFTSFEVTIQLTEKGFKNYEEVLEIVFEYIQILKTQGVPDYIIQQIKKMNNLNFEFRNNMNGLSKAIELAKLTLRYPYKNMNNFYFLFNGCPQEMIKEALSYLSLESLLMFLSSNEYKDLKEEEPIYKCCYEFEPISSEIKKKIEKITLLKSIKINLINSKKTNSTQISKFQKSIHLFPKILKL